MEEERRERFGGRDLYGKKNYDYYYYYYSIMILLLKDEKMFCFVCLKNFCCCCFLMTIAAPVRGRRSKFVASVFAEFGRSVVTFAAAAGAVRLEVDGDPAATFLPRVTPVEGLGAAEGA